MRPIAKQWENYFVDVKDVPNMDGQGAFVTQNLSDACVLWFDVNEMETPFHIAFASGCVMEGELEAFYDVYYRDRQVLCGSGDIIISLSTVCPTYCYVNSSRGLNVEPNCSSVYPQVLSVTDETWARNRIMPGDQLLWDYPFTPQLHGVEVIDLD
jgi:hypothetical protein